jgi:predicted RNA-binding Zn-ribbon protein involved in translation (DUF1610 family)
MVIELASGCRRSANWYACRLQVARMVHRIGRRPGQCTSTGQNLAPGSLVRVMPSPADWQGSSSK